MPPRLAPILFVLLWSSSFVSTKAGLVHLSPLLFVAVRLAACAAILALAQLAYRRAPGISAAQWLHCGVAGALLQGLGLMASHVGMNYVPAAQVALVQSLTPLLTASFGIVLLRERLRPPQWAGLLIGVAGVALVVGPAALASATQGYGLAMAGLGVVGFVGGTLYFGRFCRAVPLLAGTAAQFIAAAGVSVLGAWLLEVPRWDASTGAIAAIAWNTLPVSLGGIVLYAWMLKRGTAARASANFYLVPGTAGCMAWLLLGEPLPALTVAGLAVAGTGCWLVSRRP